jgi:aminoglycoside phosphotransferase (APT) family kinase protein
VNHPAPPGADLPLRRSSRDPDDVAARLSRWLTTCLPEGAEPEVTLCSGVDSNGMSSETVVLDVTWTEEGRRGTRGLVARVAPTLRDVPVFPSYDLVGQRRAMGLVAELTDVPVPAVRWIEPTGEVLGTPFFLMERVEGRVPPDVLPYPFGDNWLFDASPDEQRRLQDRTVEVVAALHAVPDAASRFAFLDPGRGAGSGPDTGPGALRAVLARTRAWYEFAKADAGPSPTAERALAWLETHEPATATGRVLCWGDARIGNILYDGFEPAGVLDWEMATLGPRELDLSWLVTAHQVFQSITQALGLPGMPDFLREDDVLATYERASGVRLGELDWYHVHAGLQWCIVFMRTGFRQLHFGEIEPPDDIESLMHHLPLLFTTMERVGA